MGRPGSGVPRYLRCMFAATPEPPYVAVIFTNQRSGDDEPGYLAMAEAMEHQAAAQPGYLGIESARTAQGLGITVSYWTTDDAARAWKQIAENAGMEGGVAVERVRNMVGSEGLNAATGDYEDLVKIGVIDAAKVTRSALQNAASIAALFLTTEAVIADKPEKDAPAMAGGGMEDY